MTEIPIYKQALEAAIKAYDEQSAHSVNWGALRAAIRAYLCRELRESHPIEDGEGWIEWKGGECPVDPDTQVDWRRRCDAGIAPDDWKPEWREAGDLRWSHRGSDTDIIAYRIIPSNPGTSKVENIRST